MEPTRDIRPGRPRSEAAKQAILRASLSLLRKHGLGGVTAEAVAEHAKVSKATLYRWWPCAAATAMEAFFEEVFSRFPDFHSNDPLRDVRDRARHGARLLSGDLGNVLAGLVAATHSDPRLAESFHQHYVTPSRVRLRRVVERAHAAGVLRADADVELVMDVILGAFFYRKLVSHKTTSPRTMDVLVTYVLEGIAPRTDGAAKTARKPASASRKQEQTRSAASPRRAAAAKTPASGAKRSEPARAAVKRRG